MMTEGIFPDLDSRRVLLMLPRHPLQAVVRCALSLTGFGAVVLLLWSLLLGGLTPAQPKIDTTRNGQEVFGYTQAFAQELKRIGQISPDEFAQLYSTHAAYSKGLSW